jgi:hypothetical protein
MGKIERTEFQYNIKEIQETWDAICVKSLTHLHWYQKTQTCLQHSSVCVDKFTEGCGSIKRAEGRTEQDFDILNPIYKGTIFEKIISDVNAVRSRIMIKPKHTCYSIHSDRTIRYHLPVYTHKHALFMFYEGATSTTLHIPADGSVWKTDTTEPHTFINAGEERTHLVMCRGE